MKNPEPKANPWLSATPYQVPRHPAPVSLKLDSNEGKALPQSILDCLKEITPDLLCRYPKPSKLESVLAQQLGVDRDCVLLTAGGDEGLMRMCKAFLGPGRSIIFPEPSFEMIRRFAESTLAEVRSVPYPGEGYPTDDVIAACDHTTSIITVVSPNNPTGDVISSDDLLRLAKEVPQAMIMLDLAYVEFAEEDLTNLALTLPNVLIFRTFSKAFGLAGLRIGYVLGQKKWITLLRSVGLPYPVSQTALALAKESLKCREERNETIAQLLTFRQEITTSFNGVGIKTSASQGNFVFAQGIDGQWWRDAMAGLGIGIRAWPNHPRLKSAIRISCPTSTEESKRVCSAIQTIAKPQAIIFDMDGVIADVSQSYRRAIVQTAATFGVQITAQDIERIKAQGDANNDWVVTQRLLMEQGVEPTLEEVTRVFEIQYQGSDTVEPLYKKERFIGNKKVLEQLRKQYKLAIVTGRPRTDAQRFLEDFNLSSLFDSVICMEDAALKPSPEPVQKALSIMGVTRAWMIGDTPDDIVAARSSGVVPIGVIPPGASASALKTTLLKSGAAIVLHQWDSIVERL